MDKAVIIAGFLEALRAIEKEGKKEEPIRVRLGDGTVLVINLEEPNPRNFFVIEGEKD